MSNTITGYRSLTQTEIDLINEIKAHAETTRFLVEKIQTWNSAPEAKRWSTIAKDSLQQGYMALTRAVAQPITF